MKLGSKKEALLQGLARKCSIASNGAHASQGTRSTLEHRVGENESVWMVVQLPAQSAASSGQKVQGSSRLVPDRLPYWERCPGDSPRVWLLRRSLDDSGDETTRLNRRP